MKVISNQIIVIDYTNLIKKIQTNQPFVSFIYIINNLIIHKELDEFWPNTVKFRLKSSDLKKQIKICYSINFLKKNSTLFINN